MFQTFVAILRELFDKDIVLFLYVEGKSDATCSCYQLPVFLFKM